MAAHFYASDLSGSLIVLGLGSEDGCVSESTKIKKNYNKAMGFKFFTLYFLSSLLGKVTYVINYADYKLKK